MTGTLTDDREAADVRDLDASAVLDAVVSARRAADAEEARLLALAVHWVDLHSVTDEHPAATFPTQRAGGLDSALGPGFFARAPLAGEGTPVSRSTRSRSWPRRSVSRTWRGSHWWRRRSSSATGCRGCGRWSRTAGCRRGGPAGSPGPPAGCRPRGSGSWTGTWPSPVNATGCRRCTRCCTRPGCAATRTRRPRWSRTPWTTAGCGWTTGSPPPPRWSPRGWTPRTRSTSTSRLGIWPGCWAGSATTGPEGAAPTGLNGSRGTLYLHLSLADLPTGSGGGRVERLGTASLVLLRDWLQRFSGVTVRPVLDPTRGEAVDAVDGVAHDPPAWMRELVILRDRHCVFPGCGVDARACDLDHVVPYLPVDRGGPPGQTTPANLAYLCRRHHRAKTFAGWRYRRLPDPPETDPGDPPGPTYEWTSPHLRSYRVTPHPVG